ncbi:MAG: penicillin acylase family protein [Maricaulaceae bacterium]|nr:penicillin acylase family protein [Maricaulaceae bacterium]
MRWVVRIFLGLLALAGLAAAAGGGWLFYVFQSTLPQTRGEVRAEGLSGEARIVRDAYGVAHIFAETEEDVFFALGYAHAQDRFFQMDLIRRFVQGRLSELMGERTLRADARSRIRGYHLVAEAALDNLGPEMRAAAEAYARGVNARLARGAPAPEYAFLMARAEPWSALDSMAVTVYMSDTLTAGEGDSIDRARLNGLLDADLIDEFLPGYPDFAPTTLKAGDIETLRRRATRRNRTAPAPASDPAGGEEPDAGSNAWVVSGDRTVTGAPLLANDPHLPLTAPGIWYFVRLNLPDGPVIGATIPGSAVVTLGRNAVSAWGFTNTGFNVTDLVGRAPGSFDTVERRELIGVRGGPTITVIARDAADGPVLDGQWFDTSAFPGQEVVLVSAALDRSNAVAEASYRIMTSRSWEAFVEAGRGWTAPMQNMHYAHADGTIGYTAPGLMPLRGEDGRWTGHIPFEELPRVRDPRGGMIASGNNRVAPDAFPHPLPGGYEAYRALRIEERLNAVERHDLDSFAELIMDVTSAHAQRILPALRQSEPETETGMRGLALMQAWDGTLAADRPEGLIFSAWLRALAPAIYADELGEAFPRFNYSRRVFIDHVLNGDLGHWCDDVSTETVETCAVTAGRALDAAMRDLARAHGADISRWRWGDVRHAVFAHPAFTGTPLDRIFTVRVPVGGDGSTVNVAHFSFRSGNFDVSHAASMRAIYDLSDLNNSRFMHAPGQSGHPMSRHYRDLAPMWGAGRWIEIRDDWGPASPPPGARTLLLLPAE